MEKWLNRYNSTFLVFIFTVLGYAMAFFFETGYLGYYKIDWNFVQITPLQIVQGTIVTIIYVVISDFVISSFVNTNNAYNVNNPIQRARSAFWITTILALLTLLVISISSEGRADFHNLSLLDLAIYLLVLFAYFGEPAIKNIKNKDWKKSLEEVYKQRDEEAKAKRLQEEAKNPQAVKGESFLKLGTSLIRDFVKPLLILASMVYFASVFGHLANTGYTDKFVTIIKSDNATKQIVVRQYHDTVILKGYNTISNKLTDGYSVEDTKNKEFVIAVLACSNSFRNNPNNNGREVKNHCPKLPNSINNKKSRY